MKIDLHIHTTYSDGVLTPDEVIQIAAELGVKTLAIADHDTTAGLKEAQYAAKQNQLNLIPAIEISALYQNDAFHVLGYFIDYESTKLQNELILYQQAREQRNQKMLDKLNHLGISITADEVQKFAGKKNFGRPHIARLMVQKGIVKNIPLAFKQYLGMEGKAYVSKELFSPQEIINMIHEAGGKAFLAHPVSLKLTNKNEHDFFIMLKDLQMDGLEVYTSAHNHKQISHFYHIAQKYNFLISGGSDLHDQNPPQNFLGMCQTNVPIQQEWLSPCFGSI